MSDIPDRQWYTKLSLDRGVAFRCPFATVESCPRYYQSLSLLGEAGSTKIPESEDQRLLTHWKSSDLWPRTEELATSLAGPPGNPSIYSNFCPEVTFERFRYFATSLTKYGDEIDSGFAHKRLARDGASHGDPRWSWESCTGQHFTECPIYAVLSHRSKAPPIAAPAKAEPWWRKYLAEIVVAIVVAIVGVVIAKVFG